MQIQPEETISRALAEETDREFSGRWQLRLAISIPALVVLFILAYGLASYRLFEIHWETLDTAAGGEALRAMLRGHMLAMIFLSILAFGVGLALAWTILRPIQAISETAKMIARGRLDHRPPRLPMAREIGDLSRSFNSMIDFLNASIQDRNRYLREGIFSGILSIDNAGKVTTFNPAGEKILGVDRRRVMGRPVCELAETLPGASRAFWRWASEAIDRDETEALEEVPLGGGDSRASLLVVRSILRDASGKCTGAMFNFRDAEGYRNLHEQLSKTDQLAALGTFTMGLAHELRNPLGVIKGTAQLLKLEQAQAEATREYIERMIREVDRLDGFVRELLDFSHQSPAPPRPVDLNRALRSAAELGRHQAEAGRALEVEIVEEVEPLPAVRVEPDRIVQALANIVRNACEAARPGSRVTLRSRHERTEDDEFVRITVHNTGSTIDAKDRDRIFDPFFSSKEKGSGLGLAIAYQIVQQNNGTLQVESGPDEVSFHLRFRAAPSLTMEGDKMRADRTLKKAGAS